MHINFQILEVNKYLKQGGHIRSKAYLVKTALSKLTE